MRRVAAAAAASDIGEQGETGERATLRWGVQSDASCVSLLAMPQTSLHPTFLLAPLASCNPPLSPLLAIHKFCSHLLHAISPALQGSSCLLSTLFHHHRLPSPLSILLHSPCKLCSGALTSNSKQAEVNLDKGGAPAGRYQAQDMRPVARQGGQAGGSGGRAGVQVAHDVSCSQLKAAKVSLHSLLHLLWSHARQARMHVFVDVYKRLVGQPGSGHTKMVGTTLAGHHAHGLSTAGGWRQGCAAGARQLGG